MDNSSTERTRLYLAARWGNNEEGPNGKDTLYLVAAKNHIAAGECVVRSLTGLPSTKVLPKANWICLLGTANHESSFTGILKGPYLDVAGIRGCSIFWSREHHQNKWQEHTAEEN